MEKEKLVKVIGFSTSISLVLAGYFFYLTSKTDLFLILASIGLSSIGLISLFYICPTYVR